jgi:hypothetical protein
VSATLRVYLFAQVLEKVALLPSVFDMINCIRAMMSVATSSLPRVTALFCIGHTQTGGIMSLLRGKLALESSDGRAQMRTGKSAGLYCKANILSGLRSCMVVNRFPELRSRACPLGNCQPRCHPSTR